MWSAWLHPFFGRCVPRWCRKPVEAGPEKLCLYTTYYPQYLRDFYRKRPDLLRASYEEQLRILHGDAFGWSDAYDVALRDLGYEVTQIVANAEPLQRAWATEHGLGSYLPPLATVLKQLEAYRPDVLWFDSPDKASLAAIKSRLGSIRLILGWTGSALPQEAWDRGEQRKVYVNST